MSNRDSDVFKKREQDEHTSSGDLALNFKSGFEKAAHQIGDALGQAQNEVVLRVTNAPVAAQYVASISPALARQYVQGREIVLARQASGKSLTDFSDLTSSQRKVSETYQKLHSDLPSKIPFYNKEILARDLDRDIVRKALPQAQVTEPKRESKSAPIQSETPKAIAAKVERTVDKVQPAAEAARHPEPAKAPQKDRADKLDKFGVADKVTKAADEPAAIAPQRYGVKPKVSNSAGNALVTALEAKSAERPETKNKNAVKPNENQAVDQRRLAQSARKIELPPDIIRAEYIKAEKFKAESINAESIRLPTDSAPKIPSSVETPNIVAANSGKDTSASLWHIGKGPEVEVAHQSKLTLPAFGSPSSGKGESITHAILTGGLSSETDKTKIFKKEELSEASLAPPGVIREIHLRTIAVTQTQVISALIGNNAIKVRSTLDQTKACTAIKIQLPPELASRLVSAKDAPAVRPASDKKIARAFETGTPRVSERRESLVAADDIYRSQSVGKATINKLDSIIKPGLPTKAATSPVGDAVSRPIIARPSSRISNAGQIGHTENVKASSKIVDKTSPASPKTDLTIRPNISDNAIKTSSEAKVALREYKFTCSDENQKYLSGPEIALAAIIALAGTAKLRPEASALQGESVAVVQHYDLDFIDAQPELMKGRVPNGKKLQTEVEAEVRVDSTEQIKVKRSTKPAVLIRPRVLIGANDTLISIAEQLFNDAGIGWLILRINNDIDSKNIEGKTIVRLRCRQEILIPVYQDILDFQNQRTREMNGHNLITIVEENQIDREVLSIAMAPMAGSSSNCDPLQELHFVSPGDNAQRSSDE